MATMFVIIMQLENNVSIIDHTFMATGPAAIEKKKNKSSIKFHHPRDWYEFIRTVGVNK